MHGKIVQALKHVRHDVLWFHDEPSFKEDTPDVTWIAEVSRRGWVILTHDKRLRYRPHERKVIMESGAACFVFVHRRALDLWSYFQLVSNALDKIVELVDQTPRPFIYTINSLGQVRAYVVSESVAQASATSEEAPR